MLQVVVVVVLLPDVGPRITVASVGSLPAAAPGRRRDEQHPVDGRVGRAEREHRAVEPAGDLGI